MSSRNNVFDYIRNTLDDVREMSTLNQILIGGSTGLATGYILSKVGRIAAFTVGSGVILLQLAQHLGYIEIKLGKKASKLEQLKKKAIKAAEESGLTNRSENDKAEKIIKEAKKFFQENFTFGVSFGGSVLVGFSF